jgi:hypothetical protein
VCHSARLPPTIVASTRRFIHWSGDWPGLVDYRLGRPRDGEDLVVIEPQLPDYWPRMPPIRDADALVLSRFVYMRRRGNDMILEFTPCRRAVQNLQSEDCDRLDDTLCTATSQMAPPAGCFSGG